MINSVKKVLEFHFTNDSFFHQENFLSSQRASDIGQLTMFFSTQR